MAYPFNPDEVGTAVEKICAYLSVLDGLCPS